MVRAALLILGQLLALTDPAAAHRGPRVTTLPAMDPHGARIPEHPLTHQGRMCLPTSLLTCAWWPTS
jgi:hypothetical protein